MGVANWCCYRLALTRHSAFGEDGKEARKSFVQGEDSRVPVRAHLEGISFEERMDDPYDVP